MQFNLNFATTQLIANHFHPQNFITSYVAAQEYVQNKHADN